MSSSAVVTLRRIGWGRVALSALAMAVALLVARFSWDAPMFIDAEHALYDARIIATAPQIEQDERILIIPYTDETLINTGKRSPLDRTTLARALKRIDQMGAKSIGIDVLIDQPQADDPLIISALRSMKTPTFLAYASTRVAKDKILLQQQQFLESFGKAISGGAVGSASIVIQADSDNVQRRWGQILAGEPPRIPNAMIPSAANFTKYEGSIAFRQPAFKDKPIFATIPIDTFADDALFASPETSAIFSAQVKGRHVLIGGNIQDIDTFETPLSRAKRDDETRDAWGIELFAHMLAQIMDNRVLTPIPGVASWVAALIVVLVGGVTATASRRPLVSGLLLLGQFGVLAGLPFWLASRNIDTYGLAAFGWIVGWFLALVIIGSAARALGSEQRRFAQSALGKYLPPSIASEILRDPDALQLHGQKREIFALFTDLEGFTKLSHAIEPEMVAMLLNRYLEMLCDVVFKYGGTIDKFVGDAVVAFWGAPISRHDDGERAVRAAIAMHDAGEAFRKSAPDGIPPIGKTRVGLHFGEAIVGNFGGEGRIQYTALGDTMNTASRLESANKQIKSSILISEDAATRSGLDVFRPLGRVQLRGRPAPITVFEPVPEMAEVDRLEMSDITNRAINGDVTAITELRRLSTIRSNDEALSNLIFRITNQQGGHFVLD